jgi:hypothetical protein
MKGDCEHIHKRRKLGSLPQSAVLNVGRCGRGAANSRAIINWGKKMMISIYISRSGIASIIALPRKESFTRRFFVEKVLDDFDKERAETMHLPIGQIMILIVSGLQDYPTRPLARISLPAISNYSET